MASDNESGDDSHNLVRIDSRGFIDFPHAEFTRIVPVLRKTMLSRRPSPQALTPALLCLGVILVFTLEAWQNKLGFASLLQASPESVFERREYWRVFTTLATHGDLKHFLSNTVFFAILGYLLFGYFGWIAFPAIALLGGALTNLLAIASFSGNITLVGASGVVYFMAGFWLTMYCCIERRHSMTMRILRSLGFTLILLAPTTYEPVVSYRTHAIGFVLGLLGALPYFKARKRWIRSFEQFEYVPEDEAYGPQVTPSQ